MIEPSIHAGPERQGGLDRRGRADDAAYSLAIDAIRQASAATTTAALAAQKMADHEALCGDRWEQSRKAIADLAGAMADLNANAAQLRQLFAERQAIRSQTRGAWSALRDVLAVAAAIVAAAAALYRS